MKTLRFLLLSLVSLAFVACENGDNNALPNKPVESECYTGTMTVDQNDDTMYTQDEVQVDYEILDGKLNFVMYKVKFAEGMPIKLDMVVEGADYIEDNGLITISGDGITTTLHNAVCDNILHWDEGWLFNLREPSELERSQVLIESLTNDLTNTQLALCDVYEMIGG